MPANTFMTVRDLLRYAVTRFQNAGLYFGHGSTNAWDEAVYLILHTLSLPLDRLEPFLDAHLLADEIASVLDVIERRVKERIPAAYLTNEAWLGEYRFYVDERVIVPRSFIHELIHDRFAPWMKDPYEVTQVLDLCTGSGCLAIMLADAFPYAHVDAVDMSLEALEVAQKNVDDYLLNDQITLIQSDLFTQMPQQLYDVIVSNPPYVNADSMFLLPDEYLKEPQMALAGGTDGMDLVRRIISDAVNWLKPDGMLIVETGNEYEHVIAAFPNLEMTWLSSSGGDDRVFLVTRQQLLGAGY